MSKKKGLVYLIGAGPGDPGLITVRGLECLRQADVVVYDSLANRGFLKEARPGAEIVFVGKSAGQHTLPQEKINDFLVQKASEGKTVARLKGGDPFVFGRGGEEAMALAKAGLAFGVVPGVTSAVAAPAYAGIPITHRDYTSTFAVITGHEDPTKGESSLDWAKIATGIGTLVFLMGASNLKSIAEELMAHGRTPGTPVAVIQCGTTNRQKTVTGTLADIVEVARRAKVGAPAVIVVGEVVNLREELRWFDRRPLYGLRVLVTRARDQASALSALLREQGAEPVECPVIEIQPPADSAALDEALTRLASYDWLVFTSANGVAAFFQRLSHLNLDVRALKGVRLAAIGPATAAGLERFGLRLDYVPEVYVGEAVAQGLKDMVQGKRVLLPRAETVRPVLAEELQRSGAEVDQVVAYRTVTATSLPGEILAMLEEKKIDVVTFTSASTVEGLMGALKGTSQVELLSGVTVACIGPITAEAAEAKGLQVDVRSEEHTIPGLVDAIVRHFEEHQAEGQ
jgi:uroporphyrinogen III methyltransferase / synthase